MEPMAKLGRGIAYTKFDSGKIFRDTTLLKEEVLKIYNQHAKKVTEAVDKKIEDFGSCLIIDCHSFNDTPLKTDLDKTIPRPDICIGIDTFHTPEILTEATLDIFRSYGYSFKINSPYSGCYIPLKHLNKDKRVMGIMIEINKRLYLDSNFQIIPNQFAELKKVIDIFLVVMNMSDFYTRDSQALTK